jgi:hypothetical protein
MPTTRVRIRGVRKRRAAPKVGRSTPDSGHSRSVVGGPFCATDRDRGASRLRPSHTTVRTGPYTAVRMS